MSEDLVERLRKTASHLIDGSIEDGSVETEILCDAADEIERLQDAKRRALQIADERAKEAVELQLQLARARQRIEGTCSLVEEASILIWCELCPGLIMGDDDRSHYEAAAKASAMIAKIPLPLSRYIAATFRPKEYAEAAE